MKLSPLVSHGLCVAFGIGATVFFLRPGDEETRISSSEIPALQPASPEALQDQLADPSRAEHAPDLTAVKESVSSAPVATQVRRQPSAAEARLIDGAAMYAASFRPGIVGAESMPEFASDYVLASEGDRAAEREQALEFANQPIDGWSGDMEQRIQHFLQGQPELLQVRVSVNCRSSQCLVQLIELSGERRLSNTLAARLSTEPWYRENFHPVGTRGITPNGVGDVHYARLVLPRRLQE